MAPSFSFTTTHESRVPLVHRAQGRLQSESSVAQPIPVPRPDPPPKYTPYANERSRTQSSPPSSKSPMSSIIHPSPLPTPYRGHEPEPTHSTVQSPARHGANANLDMDARSGSANGAAIYGSDFRERTRTLSASSSGHLHARSSVKKLPPTPPGAGGASSAASARTSPLAPVRTHTHSAATFAASPSASSSLSSRSAQMASPPGPGGSAAQPAAGSSSPAATTPPPKKRPSLASPLPPAPLVPTPPISKRFAPAPLNLVAPSSTSTPSSSRVHSRHTSSSVSSPQISPRPSAPTAITHGSSKSSLSGHTQAWSQPQFVTVTRPSTANSTLPESPSTTAMMKRLLSKPAPVGCGGSISSSSPTGLGFGLGLTSGSESEGWTSGGVSYNRRKTDAFLSGRERRTKKGEDSRTPAVTTAEIQFDMNLDALDKGIATLGQWVPVGSQPRLGSGERNVPSNSPLSPLVSSPSPAETKEKVKEKRRPSVLRRKSSANSNSASHHTPTSHSNSNSNLNTPALPPQPSFSPISLSPINSTLYSSPSPIFASHLSEAGPNEKSYSNHHDSAFTSEQDIRTHAVSPSLSHRHHPLQKPAPPTPTAGTSRSQSQAMHRSVSASALHAPRSPVHSSSSRARNDTGATAPGGTAASSSLRPPPLHPYPSSSLSRGSSRSRGSSPARSPIVSTLVPGSSSAGTPSPTSARGPVPAMPPPPEKERGKPAVTPAASLIEAYKRQEREREEREKERMARLEEEERKKAERRAGVRKNLGDEMPARPQYHSHSQPSSRRHSISLLNDDYGPGNRADSISATGAQAANPAVRWAATADSHLAADALGRRKAVHSFASEHTTDDSALDLVPRVDTPQAGVGERGFDVIERMMGTQSNDEQEKEGSTRRRNVVSPGPPATQPQSSRESADVAAPYYTVFGSSAGRVAAVGGRDDAWDAYGLGYWDSGMLARRATASPAGVGVTEKEKGKEKEKPSLGRSLSRKMSGRWRKQGGAVVGVISEDEREGRVVARASMQEKRKAPSTTRREMDEEKRLNMKNRRSLRLSIDKFDDRVFKHTAVDVESDGEMEAEKKLPSLPKTEAASKGEPSPSASSPGGSRFWRLMKRISIGGGMREKFHGSSPESPPPVPPLPPLPKDHILHESRSTDSSLRFLRSPPSMSSSTSSSPIPPANTTKHSSSSSTRSSKPTPLAIVAPAPVAVPSPPQPAAGPSQPRPSTTTRSSSPVSSSDVASSKFFHRPQSARSSTSSLGEEVPPPMPKPPPGTTTTTMLSQHIIAPSELRKVHEDDGTESKSERHTPRSIPIPPTPTTPTAITDDWMIVRSPSVELPSLPLPPRRFMTQPGSMSAAVIAVADAAPSPEHSAEDISRSESPTIPSFSTSDAVNAFPSRRLSAAVSSKSKNSPSSPHPPSAGGIGASSLLASTSATPPPTSLPPPPRPMRSAQRPPPAPSASTLSSSPSGPSSLPQVEMPAGRRSESHVRGNPTRHQLANAHNRRSSGGMSTITTTSTVRPYGQRRSSSIGAPSLSMSVSASSSLGSRRSEELEAEEEDADEKDERKFALTEQEKADKWADLLERSEKAGGTLHLELGLRLGR